MSAAHDLLDRAQDLPYGPERLALTEEAVREADLAQDGAAGYAARKDLIEAATYAGQSEKMLVAFAWCRTYADTHPDEFGEWEQRELAWYHKWVLSAVHHFPQIPLPRVLELHADYARRVQALGVGAGTVPYFRMALALHRGDLADARVAFNLWQFARRDSLSDCAACEAQAVADYHEAIGDDAGCAAQVDRILQRGMTCAHIPHATHGMVLPALLRLGRWDDARRHHEQGRDLIAGDPDHLTPQARHLEYLSVTDLDAALAWYARHLGWAERTAELDDRLDLHLAGALLFQQVERAGHEHVTLSLPQDVPGHRPDGRYAVRERQRHHAQEAAALAQRFDERNGTEYHARRLDRTLALGDLPRPPAG
ncbi:catechol 2,3-dioxygenase-like lactoylglutathione lyase family enzyme [Deinococcus metalli]|uniref:Catechol 2,3-dioxygenase-like lactoylglutathione lyase family enzyme n=1 Tax=Deinococcus metalli TaxID=1141878 RepID=A0A7W8KHJ4_9DEIO|nr:hypothetical protein [Deinococcus metalli]MBB5377131.1 catechol 2,3-dioxygenase-like lactoylglutathione lyase family enzyme [Deinococcus metalli]GHF48764.1 hypothetical protein GCM10017781_26440 [Deinococcus metalli]